MKVSTEQVKEGRSYFWGLDGLRGVAAFIVIVYHLGEGFATSPIDQWMNHGYLAVDFFFVLSGFVLGTAYESSWQRGMSIWDFMKRRVLRLHPMVLLGAVIGCIAFLLQGSVQWSGEVVGLGVICVSLALHMLLLPAFPGTSSDIRGYGEMYPLNGPAWSLFFEYLGSLVYALCLRRLATRTLFYWAIALGIGVLAFSTSNLSGSGHMGVGWSLGEYNFLGGLLRVGFSMTAGLWLSRVYRQGTSKGLSLAVIALLLIGLMAVPHWASLVGEENSWGLSLNGLYDTLCIVLVFPSLVYFGARAEVVEDSRLGRLCRFLGELSYPLYLVHYPLMYLFYARLWSGEELSSGTVLGLAVGTALLSLLLAYLAMRYYDRPIRRWLSRRFLLGKS